MVDLPSAPRSGDRIGLDRFCCFIGREQIEFPEGCPQPAEWTIEHGPRPDQATDACDDHVWHLITDDDEQYIQHLTENISFKLVRDQSREEQSEEVTNEHD